MDYKSFEPASDLEAFIRCYWTLEGPAEKEPEKQRIVPDGCMEMIFHYGDLFKQYITADDFIIQPRCFVFGQITRPLEIQATGITGIFSVRFHPNGFMPFARMSMAAMENRAVALQELFGEEGILLEQRVLKAASTDARIEIVEEFLLQKLVTSDSIDRITKSSLEVLLSLNGQLSVDDLSKQLNINRRQLERRFSAAIGLSPKQLSKIIRLQSALKMLANDQFTSLTTLAHDGAYYDQAHFIKDFKEFTGVSPRKFYAGNLKLSALFIGTD